jgi:hypothetical protein
MAAAKRDITSNTTTIILAIVALFGSVSTGIVTVMTYNKAAATKETHVAVNSRMDKVESAHQAVLAALRAELATLKAELNRREAGGVKR